MTCCNRHDHRHDHDHDHDHDREVGPGELADLLSRGCIEYGYPLPRPTGPLPPMTQHPTRPGYVPPNGNPGPAYLPPATYPAGVAGPGTSEPQPLLCFQSVKRCRTVRIPGKLHADGSRGPDMLGETCTTACT